MNIDERQHFLWIEKYRPQSLENYIGNEHMKSKFEGYIQEQDIPHLLLVGPAGTGKAQPLYSKVLTEHGWKPMGEIEVGDKVYTPSGELVDVLATFYNSPKPIVEIEFVDGRIVRCCEEHLWKIHAQHAKDEQWSWDIISTKRLIKLWNKDGKRVGLPLSEPVPFTTKELRINPYLMGALLGDGHIPDGNKMISFSTADDFIKNKIESLLPNGYHLSKLGNSKYDYKIVGNEDSVKLCRKGVYSNYIKHSLNFYGVLGKHAWEKFIPESYLDGDIEQRYELLQGLMDTDGMVGKTGDISITTTSQKMAKDIQRLVWSLGGIANITQRQTKYPYKGEIRIGRVAYRVGIRIANPKKACSLPRKLEKLSDNYQYSDQLKLRIKSIREIGNEPCKCIFVNHKDHLYITDDYVVTHNTTAAKILINSIDCDSMVINASDENNIETVRTKIRGFAATRGFKSLKIILLDEFDGFTQAGQGALRNMMEQFSRTTRFILTANYEQKIIDPIYSRTQEFKIIPPSKRDTAIHLAKILKKEGVEYDVNDVKLIIDSYFPDIRKVLGEAQSSSRGGKLVIDRSHVIENDYKMKVVDILMKGKTKTTLQEIRQLFADAAIKDFTDLYKILYEKVTEIAPNNISAMILAIAEGQYRDSLVVDKEINACSTIIQILECI